MENKDIFVGNEEGQRDELEELRRQVNELRYELGHSKIVNDRVIRQAMRGRSSWLGTFVKVEAVSIPIFGAIFAGFLWLFEASIWPAIVFVIIAIISTWFDSHTLTIQTKAILTQPMSELRVFLNKQKKMRLIQFLIEAPLTVLWLIWFFLEIKHTLVPGTIGEELFGDGLNIGLGFSLVFGMIIAGIIFVKAQNTNDALIDTIDANLNEEQ